MEKVYIFDLDDTLSKTDQRSHFLEQTRPNWNAFNAACIHDEPNKPIINIMNSLLAQGAMVFIFTGRSEDVETDTIEWLTTHTDFSEFDALIMRPSRNYVTDDVLKKTWYESLPDEIKDNVVSVFEDRDSVVKMWRGIGLPCFQVNYGDF